MEWFIISLFVLSLIIQTFFYVVLFSKLLDYYPRKVKKDSIHQGVSVIVCAHNERQNLAELIPLILKQVFPLFEIIVVNDRSTDGTELLLNNLAKNFNQIKIIRIDPLEKNISPKKYALTQGIISAKFNHLLLTDADCLPQSSYWIREMSEQLQGDKEVTLAYSPYLKMKGLLNLLIRFETFYTAIQYFSLALAGKPYMGVGRNLAYTKDLFLRNNGFKKHEKIVSGDDDLFGNQVFTKKNVAITLTYDSLVFSKPKLLYLKWFAQKTRHLSAGIHYNFDIQMILGLLSFSHILFYMTAISLFITNTFLLFMIIGFIFRTLLFIYIFVRISKKLHEQFSWYLLPFLDFIYILNYILFGFNSIFSKNSKWT